MARGGASKRNSGKLACSVAFEGDGWLKLEEIGEGGKAILRKLRGVNVFDFLSNHKPLRFYRRDRYLTEGLLFLGITAGTESC